MKGCLLFALSFVLAGCASVNEWMLTGVGTDEKRLAFLEANRDELAPPEPLLIQHRAIEEGLRRYVVDGMLGGAGLPYDSCDSGGCWKSYRYLNSAGGWLCYDVYFDKSDRVDYWSRRYCSGGYY